ncbi:carboxymuconolactone decarboxylase family protein [Piscinibacter sp. XHJ-5]|uniref:carboxymuconolactone decarboxylase family protein n=1 Tax=Piscinibacter sp. XHJ-5 TaxID=3037797 RepID=UPI002453056C|nr:carboxymuconolactone decarboxylase family protein [Piscinibacter sp. XHJ-5]
MSFIKTIPPDAARDGTAAMYRRQQQHWGYVPNYAKVFCHRPELMARWAALLAEVKRPLDRRRLELVTFVAAHELGHSACSLAHGCALREHFSDEEIVAIAQQRVQAQLSPAEQAMLRFARRVARDAASVTADDVDELRAHGFDDAAIFDIAAAVAARAFFTKLLDAMGVQPDAPFAGLPPALRDALAVGRPIDARPPVRMPVDGVPALG